MKRECKTKLRYILLFSVQFNSESSAIPQSASRIADNCGANESIIQTKCTSRRIRFRSDRDNNYIASAKSSTSSISRIQQRGFRRLYGRSS